MIVSCGLNTLNTKEEQLVRSSVHSFMHLFIVVLFIRLLCLGKHVSVG